MHHEPRAHPWRHSAFEGGGSYIDFKAKPGLIREVLEDFTPFDDQQAVQTFYSFLEYLNGSDSVLETNDCALRPPHAHEDLLFNKAGLRLQIDGRVECLYRELRYNLDFEAYAWLIRRYFYELCFTEPDFRNGMIEIGMRPTYFPTLKTMPSQERYGERIYFQFRAYGCDESQTWANLDIIFCALNKASLNVHDAIRAGF